MQWAGPAILTFAYALTLKKMPFFNTFYRKSQMQGNLGTFL